MIGLAFAWLLGALTVAVLWPRTRAIRRDLPLVLSLGLAAGLALTSVTFFAASLVSGRPLIVSLALELILLLALLASVARRRRGVTVASPVSSRGHPVAATLLFQLVVVATVVAVRVNDAEPYGGWDGWAIWNLHARLIARGGEAWPALLASPSLAWSHLDYPLLVSASVARAWAWAGGETPLAAAAVATLFGVATVGTLVGGLLALGLRGVAFLAGVVLLGTPFFVTLAANQHADVPLGGFMLATIALLALTERGGGAPLALLAGAMAGAAAWTKNEGLLFAVVVAAMTFGANLPRGRGRIAVAFAIGLLVALAPTLYFKTQLAPAGDLFAQGMDSRLGQLVDGGRHATILRALGRDLLCFGEWTIAPFGLMLLALIGRAHRGIVRADGLAVAALVLVAAGYYAVYLLTPLDLAWHLDTSLVRLLLQLWPATIFLWALAVPGAADEPVARPSRRPRLAWLAVNLLLAAGVLVALARQRARHELAAAANVSVVAGEGWFGRETDDDHTWHWSRGTSALQLHISRDELLTLSFDLRAHGTRTVRIRLGDQTLWQGCVGEAAQHVELAGLKLSTGVSTLAFSTDAPAVPESTAADARALTFAVYDVRLRR